MALSIASLKAGFLSGSHQFLAAIDINFECILNIFCFKALDNSFFLAITGPLHIFL